MSTPLTPDQIDELLSSRQGLVRLARRLVRDDQTAQDIAQDALVVGLTGAGAAKTSLGPWLSGVAKNMARRELRSDERRRRREQARAKRERVASTESLALRAEAQRRVLAALAELDEPFRSMLLLRYFEELSPKRIAAHTGVPLATVKSRLHRGLTRMRAALDERHEEGRRGWALPLAASIGGGVIMKKTGIALTAIVLLSIGGKFVYDATTFDEATDPSRETTIESPRPLGNGVMRKKVELRSPPKEVSVDIDESSVVERFMLVGRVIGEGRHPVPNTDVTVLLLDKVLGQATTNQKGEYHVDVLRRDVVFAEGDAQVRLTVRAIAPDGKAGYLTHAIQASETQRTGPFRVAPILVKPAERLTIDVYDVEGPVARAFVVLDRHIVFRTNEAGRVVTSPLVTGGELRALVIAKEIRPTEVRRSVRPSQGEVWRIDVAKPDRRVVRVEEVSSGDAVSGARVRMSIRHYKHCTPLLSMNSVLCDVRTGSDGLVTVDCADPFASTMLKVTSDRIPSVSIMVPFGRNSLDPSGTGPIVIQIPATKSLRFPLAQPTQASIADGTPVMLRSAMRVREFAHYGMHGLPSRGTIVNGHLVVPHVVPTASAEIEFVAVLPDGRSNHAASTWVSTGARRSSRRGRKALCRHCHRGPNGYRC